MVLEAAELLLKRPGVRTVLRVKEHDDPVTNGDLLVQEHVAAAIERALPKHGLITEEGEGFRHEAEYVWILDPIDGSKHYARGIPLYTISLALRRQQELILGVVHAPDLGQTFCAATDRRATLNGNDIGCSSRDRLEDSYIYLELPPRSAPSDARQKALAIAGLLVRYAQRVRVVGVGSLGLCWCAMGSFDVYVNVGPSTRIWDTAAAQVVLRQAGGVYTDCAGAIVAGSPGLHRQILGLLGL